tara:strand:- start:1709 stop:1885 length:177 start_codon:yes stop_codon:yes gene_type:complete
MPAVFSPKDLETVKKALGVYIRMSQNGVVADNEMRNLLSLYHRLGRVTDVEKDDNSRT